MTREKPLQNELYSPKDLGARVPDDHLLRRISERLDLSFVYDEVEPNYGAVGHESLPPPTIIKLMLLLVLYKVEYERELFRELPMRIDWLWFLGYDLSSRTPNHSVLSKARKRWGARVFEKLFARSIQICMDEGLIDGRELLADSSLIDANASVDSLFRVAHAVAVSGTARLDEPADEPDDESGDKPDQSEPVSENPATPNEPKYRSKTDPDATGAKRRGEIQMRPRYQTHRGVDRAEGVITATAVGPGHENEANRLEELINQHTAHTGRRIATLTADSKYGTAGNLEYCEWNQITAYITPFRNHYTRPKKGKFTECCFRYDESDDTYTCPAGQKLVRTKYRADKDAYRYSASAKVCRSCPVRELCTTSRHGRTISRQLRQAIFERSTARMKTKEGKDHKKLRRWLMEGSFARSVRLGYKRAHVRGLPNMIIQDYLVAAAQNLLILLWSKRKKSLKTTPTPSPQHDLRPISALRITLRLASELLSLLLPSRHSAVLAAF